MNHSTSLDCRSWLSSPFYQPLHAYFLSGKISENIFNVAVYSQLTNISFLLKSLCIWLLPVKSISEFKKSNSNICCDLCIFNRYNLRFISKYLYYLEKSIHLFTFKEISQPGKESALFTICIYNKIITATGQQCKRKSTIRRTTYIRKFIS